MGLIINPVCQMRKVTHGEYSFPMTVVANYHNSLPYNKIKLFLYSSRVKRPKINITGWKSRLQKSYTPLDDSTGESIPWHFQLWWLSQLLSLRPHLFNLSSHCLFLHCLLPSLYLSLIRIPLLAVGVHLG